MKSCFLLIAALLVILTFVVFAPVFGHGFINYDDGAYVTENRHVTSGLSWPNVSWAFSFSSCEDTGNWHPLTWLSLMSDVTLFGVNPSRMHLVNLMIHIFNVLLLFVVLTKMTNAVWPSAFVAAVFGVHPLHVESVAWISERKDVLSTFFVFLAILSHLQFVARDRKRWHIVSLLFFVLSLMSKQMYVTLPFLLLLLDYWPLKRFTKVSGISECDHGQSLRKLVVEKLPFLLTTVLFSVCAFAGQRRGGAIGSFEEFSALQRCLNACVSYVAYLWQTIWPVDLVVFYPYPQQLPWGQAILAVVILTVVTVCAARMRTHQPNLIVGWLWYVGTLVPVIGVVQIGRQRMADRYMYFPMIGLLVGIVWLVSKWAAAQPSRQKFLQAAGVTVVVGLACVARIQTSYWADSLTLFSHAAEVAESSLAYTKVGYERAQLGEFGAATRLFHSALRLDPDYVAAHNSLGNTCLAEGNPHEAIPHFKRAIELDPDHAEAHYNLGIIYSWLGQLTQAVAHYENALRMDSDDASIHTNLGIAHMMLKQNPDALDHLQRAIAIEPDLAEANFTLGNLLSSLERDSEAIMHFQRVLKTRPNSLEVHHELARLYEKHGNSELAARHRRLSQDEPTVEQ